MKHFNIDDLIVHQEESPLHDSHVTAYKRHHGIQDSHVECRDRFKANLHDSHVQAWEQHEAKRKPKSSLHECGTPCTRAVVNSSP